MSRFSRGIPSLNSQPSLGSTSPLSLPDANAIGFPKVVFISLGSNIGDREFFLQNAICELSSHADIDVTCCSDIMPTLPVGVESQPPFLNQVLRIYTRLSAQQLLVQLKNIEQKQGRQKRFRWGPREIDLDILLFGQQAINQVNLVVPHPELLQRDFFMRLILAIYPLAWHPAKREFLSVLVGLRGPK